MGEASTGSDDAPPFSTTGRVLDFLVSAVSHLAALVGVVAISAFEFGRRQTGSPGRALAFLLLAVGPLLLYVLTAAWLARHWTRRKRPELVVVEVLFLIPVLLVTLLVLTVSSIK